MSQFETHTQTNVNKNATYFLIKHFVFIQSIGLDMTDMYFIKKYKIRITHLFILT